MYELTSAFFLTTVDSDVGFPAFQNSRDNRVFTCTLNKQLEIQSFVPVYAERFHSLSVNGRLPYALGDKFPYMFFRISDSLMIVDLDASADKVDEVLAQFKDHPFVRLQIARFFGASNRSRAVKAISESASIFQIDEDSKFSFISSETSLVSFESGVWEATTPESPQAFTSDELLKDFADIDKAEATDLLQRETFKASDYWPYLFVIYADKFGYDEFLFILAKEYFTSLATYERAPTRIVSRIVRLTFDYQTLLLRNDAALDRDFVEVLDELMETGVFEALSRIDPSLVTIGFRLLNFRQSGFEAADNTLAFLLENEEWLPESVYETLANDLRDTIRTLDLGDLGRFANAFAYEEDDYERMSELAHDRRRLLISVQARLNRTLKSRE